MHKLKFIRLTVVVAVLAAAFAVSAQPSPLPVPAATTGRGVYHPAVPFAVPEEFAGEMRGATYTVTTTTDEDNGSCDGAVGAGLSLREALAHCPAADFATIYVPAGAYTLGSQIDFSIAKGVTVIGEDPLTTIIRQGGTNRLLNTSFTDGILQIANMTLRDGGAAVKQGGALQVYGYGSVHIENAAFVDNTGYKGAGIFLQTTDLTMLTMNHVTLRGNVAEREGAAVVFYSEVSADGHSVVIRNSEFIDSTAGTSDTCDIGGGAIAIDWQSDNYGSVVIDNTLFENNHIGCNVYANGGAVMVYADESTLISISSSHFVNNSATGEFNESEGGAVFIDNDYGSLSITNSVFDRNSAGSGGAVYSDYASNVVIADSTFTGNKATVYDGGAILLSGTEAETILRSTFRGNEAVAYGGAVFLDSNASYIGQSQFSGNRAGDANGLGGYGGAVFFNNDGNSVEDTLIEDNHAEFGPDCSSPYGHLFSLGGNGISNTTDCHYVPEPTDQIDNLLVNGGFEQPGVPENIPAGWPAKNFSADKRKCNTAAKTFTAFGACAFVFKGGAGENAQLSQDVDLVKNTFTVSEALSLYAVADTAPATSAKIVVKAVYTDPNIPSNKVKLTFAGDTDGYQPQSAALTLADGSLSKLQVKVKHTGTGGKFALDRVYLFRALSPTIMRGEGGRSTDGVLPPPAAPDAFRGGN